MFRRKGELTHLSLSPTLLTYKAKYKISLTRIQRLIFELSTVGIMDVLPIISTMRIFLLITLLLNALDLIASDSVLMEACYDSSSTKASAFKKASFILHKDDKVRHGKRCFEIFANTKRVELYRKYLTSRTPALKVDILNSISERSCSLEINTFHSLDSNNKNLSSKSLPMLEKDDLIRKQVIKVKNLEGKEGKLNFIGQALAYTCTVSNAGVNLTVEINGSQTSLFLPYNQTTEAFTITQNQNSSSIVLSRDFQLRKNKSRILQKVFIKAVK